MVLPASSPLPYGDTKLFFDICRADDRFVSIKGPYWTCTGFAPLALNKATEFLVKKQFASTKCFCTMSEVLHSHRTMSSCYPWIGLDLHEPF